VSSKPPSTIEWE